MHLSNRQRLSVAAALAAGLFVSATSTAEAAKSKRKKKNKARNVELIRPFFSADADAEGVLRVKTNKAGQTGVLKLKNLDAKAWYEVRDAETDEVAAAQLAVDAEIEQREVARLALELELAANGPDALDTERRFRSETLDLVPNNATGVRLRWLSSRHGAPP